MTTKQVINSTEKPPVFQLKNTAPVSFWNKRRVALITAGVVGTVAVVALFACLMFIPGGPLAGLGLVLMAAFAGKAVGAALLAKIIVPIIIAALAPTVAGAVTAAIDYLKERADKYLEVKRHLETALLNNAQMDKEKQLSEEDKILVEQTFLPYIYVVIDKAKDEGKNSIGKQKVADAVIKNISIERTKMYGISDKMFKVTVTFDDAAFHKKEKKNHLSSLSITITPTSKLSSSAIRAIYNYEGNSSSPILIDFPFNKFQQK